MNGKRLGAARLDDHDLIKIGTTIFTFLSGSNVERAYYDEIYCAMTVDGLTGAYDKPYLMEALGREVARLGHSGRDLSLVLFDIDHFKEINDAHGRLGGDAILSAVCRADRARDPRGGRARPLGGDEFALLLPGDLSTLVSSPRSSEASWPRRSSSSPAPTCASRSLGLASLVPGTDVAEELVRRADERLYEAKRAGRNASAADRPREASGRGRGASSRARGRARPDRRPSAPEQQRRVLTGALGVTAPCRQTEADRRSYAGDRGADEHVPATEAGGPPTAGGEAVRQARQAQAGRVPPARGTRGREARLPQLEQTPAATSVQAGRAPWPLRRRSRQASRRRIRA